MQIINLPKSFYKAYDYALKYNIFHEFRERYEKPIREWARLRKKYKMSFEDLSKQLGFSRATYYRKRKILNELDAGKAPISGAPRAVKLRRCGDAEIALVLKIRRENPTYGKFKIYHILKRDYGFQMSESTVGRILKYLMEKGNKIYLSCKD